MAFNVTVTANTADVTATLADSDYAQVLNQLVTFTAGGALMQTVTVNVNQDTTVEPTETFQVNLTNAQFNGATDATRATITDSQGIGTIINDDTAVSVAVSPSSVLEDGATNLVYTFTRTGATTSALTINFSVGGTATFGGGGADYTQSGADSFTATTGTVTFGIGNSTATVTLDPTADTTVELNETTVLTVTAGAGYGAGAPSTATGTITNDDSATITINAPSIVEGGILAYSVTISNPVDVAVTADRATADGLVNPATVADSDYTAIANSNVTLFAAGSTTAFAIPVQTTADNKVELDEQLRLILSNLAAGGRNVTFSGGGASLTGTGTITNDDSATITINAPSIVEGGILAYSVTISNPVDVAVTADRATADGLVNPATVADSDYTAIANSNVTLFAAGSTTAFAIPVQTTADNKVELDEQLP